MTRRQNPWVIAFKKEDAGPGGILEIVSGRASFLN